MKNETKLGLIIATVFLIAFGLSKAFHLSLNPQTYQIGYTVYTEKGEETRGFIPEYATNDSACDKKCDGTPSIFAMQCRESGHKVYSGSCCQSLCSANLAASNQGQTL